MSVIERKPLDVRLRFDPPTCNHATIECFCEDDIAEAEANTFETSDGRFCVEWYLNAVGLVTRVWFDTYAEATEWLEGQGFSDFSSGE